jgi:elongation factor Ts
VVVITAAHVKELREQTGAGIMECKKALEEAKGDVAKAVEVLRKRGMAIAESKAHRTTTQGLIECYIHAGGRIGAMVELNCETDFVARTDTFKDLAHDLAMQVAAMGPLAVSEEDLPPGAEGEPSDLCLLRQPFIKDPGRTIQELIAAAVAITGENIQVRRFSRFELGQQG